MVRGNDEKMGIVGGGGCRGVRRGIKMRRVARKRGKNGRSKKQQKNILP